MLKLPDRVSVMVAENPLLTNNGSPVAPANVPTKAVEIKKLSDVQAPVANVAPAERGSSEYGGSAVHRKS